MTIYSGFSQNGDCQQLCLFTRKNVPKHHPELHNLAHLGTQNGHVAGEMCLTCVVDVTNGCFSLKHLSPATLLAKVPAITHKKSSGLQNWFCYGKQQIYRTLGPYLDLHLALWAVLACIYAKFLTFYAHLNEKTHMCFLTPRHLRLFPG